MALPRREITHRVNHRGHEGALLEAAFRTFTAQRVLVGAEMKIMGISGSLRTASVNTGLLKAAASLAPHDVEFAVYDALGNLPHFNPELDREPLPLAVADFRSQLNRSAGVVISTPEYAHGIPGVLKNALDWLVASGELYEKPIALFNPSPRTTYAQASITETLTVMSARLIPEASVNAAQGIGFGAPQLCPNAELSKRN